jgi:hypothetical protein
MILGDPPYRVCQLSIFPLSTTVRSLFLDLEMLPKLHFEPLFSEMGASKRLVCLDVTCGLSRYPDRPHISDFFGATAQQALRHIERLTLRLATGPVSEYMDLFWTPLHDSFPMLVTLFIIEDHGLPGKSALTKVDFGPVVFEKLEILYFSREIPYMGCVFPRLRHACLPACSAAGLKRLSLSPYLESLLVRSSWRGSRIDVSSLPCLKLLGLPDNYIVFDQVGCDHPLEHIWLYSTGIYATYALINQLREKIPNIPRITLKILLSTWQERAEEYRRANFESIGLITRLIKYGDTHIIIERMNKDF